MIITIFNFWIKPMILLNLFIEQQDGDAPRNERVLNSFSRECISRRTNAKCCELTLSKYLWWFVCSKYSSEWVQKSTVQNPNFESLDHAKSLPNRDPDFGRAFLELQNRDFEICLKRLYNLKKKLGFGIWILTFLSLFLFAPLPNEHVEFIIANHF